MKIRTKIALSFTTMILLFVAVSYRIYQELNHFQNLRIFSLLTERQFLEVGDLKASLQSHLMEVFQDIMVGNFSNRDLLFKANLAQIDDHFTEISYILGKKKNLLALLSIGPEAISNFYQEDLPSSILFLGQETAEFLEVKKTYEAVKLAFENSLTLTASKNPRELKQKLLEAYERIYEKKFSKEFQDFFNYQEGNFHQFNYSLKLRIKNLKWSVIYLVAIALVLSFGEFFYVTISLSRGFNQLEETTRQITKGNNDDTRLLSGKDELSQLNNSFKKMAKHLKLNRLEIAKQNEALLNSSKLSVLGELAASIAHEINNPLAVIKLRGELVRECLEKGECDLNLLKDSIDVIERTCTRIAMIVLGLQGFVQEGRNIPFETVTIRKILDETLFFCSEKIKCENIALTVTMKIQATSFECQPTQISQVLLNLINNAVDALKNLNYKWIHIEVFDYSEWLEIFVTDSGTGIPLEIQQKLMQPFFTTKELGQGTGLGLNISKRIIEYHKGRFYLDRNSTATRFVIRLPKNQLGTIRVPLPEAA